MKFLSAIILTLGIQATTHAELQMNNPLETLRPAQIDALNAQTQQFYRAAKPAVAEASKSTVILSYRGTRVAFGTAVYAPALSQTVILTKWSEINHYYNRLQVNTPNGKYSQAFLVGIYPENDLAVLNTQIHLNPINLRAAATPQLGDFIALASPDGNVRSLGVVSVKARSLRDTDKAYLGVLMNFKNSTEYGSPLTQVVEDSPASQAGLRQGDIVTTINHKTISDSSELRNILQKLTPGSVVQVNYRRGNRKITTHVRLGARPTGTDPSKFPPKRMEQMQRMGAVPSRVRYDFPSVIQSDMTVQPDDTPNDQRDNYTNECGGPVMDLNGRMVGIMIAQGSRIKSFIIPTQIIAQLIQTKPRTIRNTYGQAPQTARYSSPRKNYRSAPNRYEKVPPRAIPVDE